MNITPEIPQLDPVRVQARKHALLEEIDKKPARLGWRVAVPATGLAAAVASGVAFWPMGQPTEPSVLVSPPPEQHQRPDWPIELDRRCSNSATTHAGVGPLESAAATGGGSVTLIMRTGPESMWYCMFEGKTEVNDGGFGKGEDTKPTTYRKNPVEGKPVRLAAGRTRPEAASVRIDTADHREVTATIHQGWMIAWWPSEAEATLITQFDDRGHVLETVVPENR